MVLSKQEVEERLIKAIFGDDPFEECDCDHCPLYNECVENNPDGDANSCIA